MLHFVELDAVLRAWSVALVMLRTIASAVIKTGR
jgi:hypothetical protein